MASDDQTFAKVIASLNSMKFKPKLKSLSSTIVGAQLEQLGPSAYMLGTPEQEATYTVRKKIRHEYLLDRKERSTLGKDEE